jgi:RNA polymerase sigma factor for flagellar operon FliA
MTDSRYWVSPAPYSLSSATVAPVGQGTRSTRVCPSAVEPSAWSARVFAYSRASTRRRKLSDTTGACRETASRPTQGWAATVPVATICVRRNEFRNCARGGVSVKGSHDIDAERDLWVRCRAGDSAARSALIERHLLLCRRVARSTRVLPTAALGREDLQAAGAVGLIQAIDRFSPERGIPFEAYAMLRIRGAILDEVRRLDDLSRDARREARDDQDTTSATMSLDLLRERGGVADPSQPAEVDERTERAGLRDDVERALATIPGRERSILASYYGKGLTLAMIGRQLGVSEARISQLHSRAIAQLRMGLGVMTTPTARAASVAA